MILLFIKVIFKMLLYEHDGTIHFIVFLNTSCQSIYAVSAKIKNKNKSAKLQQCQISKLYTQHFKFI